MKRKAEKKIDVVLCKLQDLYYLGINEIIVKRLERVMDMARELESAIQDDSNWKKK